MLFLAIFGWYEEAEPALVEESFPGAGDGDAGTFELGEQEGVVEDGSGEGEGGGGLSPKIGVGWRLEGEGLREWRRRGDGAMAAVEEVEAHCGGLRSLRR